MFRSHGHAEDIRKPSIPGFRHGRQHPFRHKLRHPLPVAGNHGIAHHAHAVRIGQGDGSGKKPRLVHPVTPRKLAVAVLAEISRTHGVLHNIITGHDHRHPGADDALHRAFAVTDNGGMADPDPGHVGYGIVAARLKQAKTDSRSFTDFTDSHMRTSPCGSSGLFAE